MMYMAFVGGAVIGVFGCATFLIWADLVMGKRVDLAQWLGAIALGALVVAVFGPAWVSMLRCAP